MKNKLHCKPPDAILQIPRKLSMSSLAQNRPHLMRHLLGGVCMSYLGMDCGESLGGNFHFTLLRLGCHELLRKLLSTTQRSNVCCTITSPCLIAGSIKEFQTPATQEHFELYLAAFVKHAVAYSTFPLHEILNSEAVWPSPACSVLTTQAVSLYISSMARLRDRFTVVGGLW